MKNKVTSYETSYETSKALAEAGFDLKEHTGWWGHKTIGLYYNNEKFWRGETSEILGSWREVANEMTDWDYITKEVKAYD